MKALLEAIHVSKYYDKHTALDDVSMSIPEGSVFGLLGPNGAGKTSLIRIINQITAPDKGEIRFKGQHLSPAHTADIGYLPEERGLYKKMEVGEQALYLAQLKGLSRAEAMNRLKTWFERFEIQGWWKKKVEELSKGMQQKVQFIVTVIHEPALLILDEPFTGFDPINANLIKDELLALKAKGTTIALSTHRMESVEELCTHIALIDKSKKLLEGPVRDIRSSFKSDLFEIEIGTENTPTAENILLRHEIIDRTPHGDSISYKIRLKQPADTQQLIRELLQETRVHGFREQMPAMNDIFIQVVNSHSTHAL